MKLNLRIIAAIFLLTVFNAPEVKASTQRPIFDQFPIEDVFVGNLEPVSTMERLGLSFHGNANTRSPHPAFVLAGAFPLNQNSGPRGSGWCFGGAAGIHQFSQEASRTYTAGAYFWELMIGRAILKQPDVPDSGMRGYFEVAFRDQRPKYDDAYASFLRSINRQILDQNTAMIIRAGAAMDSRGEGFVIQKPWRLSPALDLSMHLPVVSKRSVLVSAQVRAPFRCFASWLRCSPFFRATYTSSSPKAKPTDPIEDVQTKLAWGSQFLFRLGPKYLFNFQVHWLGYLGPTQKAFIATPYVRTSFTIAF